MKPWKRSPYADLDKMVMAPALPHLSSAHNDDNNPPPGRSKVDTGVSFTDPQEWGVWNYLKRSQSPIDVIQTYRSFRDSPHCDVPKEKLRLMRDTILGDMDKHRQ